MAEKLLKLPTPQGLCKNAFLILGMERSALNERYPIGWKWAQREDAAWMMDDFTHSEDAGKIFGLKKSELNG